MLDNFFLLNGSTSDVGSGTEFVALLEKAPGLQNVVYRPEELCPARPKNRVREKTFTNCSFSKTAVRGVIFTNCVFKDCLFIGTHFTECEFHDCRFDGCNPHKARFSDTYIDPRCFSNALNPKKHSNIGAWLFWQLLRNSEQMRQARFAQTANYFHCKWKRYQLMYEFRQHNIRVLPFLRKWLPSLLYDVIAGYGYRILPFVRSTAGLLVLVWFFNYATWGALNMQGPAAPVGRSVVHSAYFTLVTITTLGFGDLTPGSPVGMLAVSVQSILGVIWLALLASVIFKRVIR